MSEEKVKVRKHKILSRPILGAVLLIVWAVCVPMIGDKMFDDDLYEYIATIVISIILFGLHKLWFRPEFKGCFSKNFANKEINKFYLLIFVIDIIIAIIGLIITGVVPPTLLGFSMALVAGFWEELTFRALPQSIMMRDWLDEKHIMFIAIFTSICFGLLHGANALMGADKFSTVIQVIFAFGFGMFLSAVYLRTANIWYAVIMHGVHDYFSFLVPGVETGLVTVQVSTYDIVANLILFVLLILAALYLLRKSVRAEIVEVWKDRWSVNSI